VDPSRNSLDNVVDKHDTNHTDNGNDNNTDNGQDSEPETPKLRSLRASMEFGDSGEGGHAEFGDAHTDLNFEPDINLKDNIELNQNN